MKCNKHLWCCLYISITFLLLNFLTQTNGANILFFFGVSTYSHRIIVWPLVEKLVDLGHKITFFQSFKPKNYVSPTQINKVKEMFPLEVETFMESVNANRENWLNSRLKLGQFGIQKMNSQLLEMMGVELCDVFLSSQETIEWINNPETKVDLIVIDGLFNECGYGIAHKFGAKVVIFATSSVFSWWHDEFGIPAETSWIPEMHMSFQFPMNYFERIVTTLLTIWIHYRRTQHYFPELEQVLRTRLNMVEMPEMSELVKIKTSLILMNTHCSEEFARSLPPSVIPVGGMHVNLSRGRNRESEISLDIAKFLDASKDEGFIYVSFGTSVKVGEASEKFQKIFIDAFENSKIRFVWKWEGPKPEKMPSNVITSKWMPQQEILAHPNIKAFISHGGLLSIQEAIIFEVPMIVFPIFADQDYNSFRIERTRRGIRLDVQTVTSFGLESAILEIISNPSYKDSMRRTAKLFKDRPQTPLDSAVWWTEYVLRHNDTSHLMPLAVNQNWLERRLLDVWSGVAFVAILIATFLYFICQTVFYCVHFMLRDWVQPFPKPIWPKKQKPQMSSSSSLLEEDENDQENLADKKSK